MIVDSHVHLWDLARGGYEWLTPDLTPINRTIGPAELAACLEETGVDSAILVQSDESDADNEYLPSDAVFGVKDSLVRTFRPPGEGDPADVSYVVDMDFALAPA